MSGCKVLSLVRRGVSVFGGCVGVNVSDCVSAFPSAVKRVTSNSIDLIDRCLCFERPADGGDIFKLSQKQYRLKMFVIEVFRV